MVLVLFMRDATLYIIAKNKRLTIAIIGVKKSYTTVAVITYLLDKVQSLNLKFKRLYLDRGFYSSAVIRWLMALDIPFIMPAIRNGKTGGINQYLKGKKSYKTTHSMNKGKEWNNLFLSGLFACPRMGVNIAKAKEENMALSI